MSLEDDVRNDLLQLSPAQMADVATFCNDYPNIELEYKIEDEDEVGGVRVRDHPRVAVVLQRCLLYTSDAADE